MSAYTPPLEGRDPQHHLLLDFNERTLPVGQAITDALVHYINDGKLQMYPSYGDVVSRIADYAGVDSANLMITNGSDQGIDLIFRAVCSEGDEAIIPGPSFAMYRQCANIEKLTIVEPQYTKEEGFPLDEVLSSINEKTKIICIANPNNPSGTGVSSQMIFDIAMAAPNAAILVDECYFEYSKESVVESVEQYPNIFVTRTFSKTWGIPSLRMGYLISSTSNILALLNVRGPYDINQLAVVAVKAALDNKDYTLDYVEEVMASSKPLFERFLDGREIPYWPSEANYIWVFFSDAKVLENQLVESGILVRAKSDSLGRVGLRITLGTLEQTKLLISLIEGFLDA